MTESMDTDQVVERLDMGVAALEHLIMRKQNQVDWLRRAIREP